MPSKTGKRYIIYISIIVFIQFVCSFFVKTFYPTDLISTEYKLIFNPTIFLSFSFIIITAILAYKANYYFNHAFTGTVLGFSILLFYIFLSISTYYPGEFIFKNYITKFLSYTFFHLGGFRELLIYLLGYEILGKLFYTVNIIFIIHMMGFLLGDLTYLVIRGKKYVHLKNDY